MQSRTDIKKSSDGNEPKDKNLGVLYTGFVEKQNPFTGSYKRRFLVLTQESIHWFNRMDSNNLFGEERGHIPLMDMLSVRILDQDSTTFEIKDAIQNKIKYFRCNSPTDAEEWVSGIRSAIKRLASIEGKKKIPNRKGTYNNLRLAMFDDSTDIDNDDAQAKVEVNVLLVSLRSTSTTIYNNLSSKNTVGTISPKPSSYGNEVVVARNPLWHRVILVNGVKHGDELVISTSNGGTVILSAEMLRDKADMSSSGTEFELAVQGVPLASSIRMSVLKANRGNNDDDDDDSYGNNNNSSSSIMSSSSRKKQKSWIDNLIVLAIKITNDRTKTATVVLAVTFLIVAISSLASITQDTSLMFVLALILSAHCLFLMLSDSYGVRMGHMVNMSSNPYSNNITSSIGSGSIISSSSMKQYSYRIILHGHAFTSPDAPVNEPEDEIPQRFVVGCDYDMKEARRRWDITKHWRETEGVNTILQKEQPHFFTIKEFYPHYHAGRGKQGHIVFYDRPGELDSMQIKARGVSVKDLIDHFIFITEYQWQILCGGDETAKSIAVLDIANVKMSDLTGDPLEYLKKTVGIANAHYPERSFVIFVVNAPVWFSLLWRVVKPLVHENTQKKVRILSRSQTLEGLQEHIDISQIPEYYGGHLDFGGRDSCRFSGPDTLAINEYVSKLNNKQVISSPRGNPILSNDSSQMTSVTTTTTSSLPSTMLSTETSPQVGFGQSDRLNSPARRGNPIPPTPADRRLSVFSSSDTSTSHASTNSSKSDSQPSNKFSSYPSPTPIKRPISLVHPNSIKGGGGEDSSGAGGQTSLATTVNPLLLRDPKGDIKTTARRQ